MKSQTIVMANQDKLLDRVDVRIDRAVEKAFEKYNKSRQHSKYVTPKKAMETLNVKVSKLQQLRNNDEIKYSKTSNRGIMYEYDSLIEYLDRNLVE